MRVLLVVSLLAALTSATNVPSSVVLLSDKFLDVKDDGYWFVKLYAPWCAHCKRLAPVWEHVAHALVDKDPSIRVAKVDCTLYPAACRTLGITGYPTLLFFRNGQIITYDGEREKEAMVAFALKCAAPTVTPIVNLVQYNEVKETSRREPIFIFVDDGNTDTSVSDAYRGVATSFFAKTSFYSISSKIAPPYLEHGRVYVVRDRTVEAFDGEIDTLSSWTTSERLPVVAKASGGSLGMLAASEKMLVLLVVNAVERYNASTDVGAFYAVGIEAAREARQDKQLRNQLQFAWLDGGSFASSIAMRNIEPPYVLALNYSTYEYYLPVDAPKQMTKAALLLWLKEGVLAPDAVGLGGRGLGIRFQRMLFETYSSVVHMFTTQPILSTCLFGVPVAFLSVIIYSLCSADFSVDRDEIYPDDDEGLGEDFDGEEEEEMLEDDPADRGNSNIDESHPKAE